MNAKWLPAIMTAIVAGLFLLLNLIQENPEPYQFPLLLAIILCLLAAIFLLSHLVQPASGSAGGDTGGIEWRAIAPGIAIGIGYYLGLESLGFYTTSYLAFLAIICIYDKGTRFNGRSFLIKSLIAALFVAALYGLFYYALHVQAPRGVLF